MIKKFLTCAAVTAAACALGAGSAAASCDEGHERDGHHERLVAAEKTGGSFEALRTSSGTGIYEGSLHHAAFVSVTD
ncbi:hypothetical protein [Streptomyces fumanus]|uniref:Lipoprotein n=1 Tax=Streptomyces fumanus TaxID=67302 RepID=A0A919A3Z5_9ACTN|nr:hypothetical protein [Streptomyces fumanus]GHE85359.1 hypothetical protein GCM10018772_05740 [Streptomyces fumanus]